MYMIVQLKTLVWNARKRIINTVRNVIQIFVWFVKEIEYHLSVNALIKWCRFKIRKYVNTVIMILIIMSLLIYALNKKMMDFMIVFLQNYVLIVKFIINFVYYVILTNVQNAKEIECLHFVSVQNNGLLLISMKIKVPFHVFSVQIWNTTMRLKMNVELICRLMKIINLKFRNI